VRRATLRARAPKGTDTNSAAKVTSKKSAGTNNPASGTNSTKLGTNTAGTTKNPGPEVATTTTATVTTTNESSQTTTNTSKADKKKENKPIEVVFVLEGDHVKMVPVKLGIYDESYYEITEGLTEGQEVVSGTFRAISRDLEDGKKAKKGPAGKPDKDEKDGKAKED
jgi:hypothetical protein